MRTDGWRDVTGLTFQNLESRSMRRNSYWYTCFSTISLFNPKNLPDLFSPFLVTVFCQLRQSVSGERDVKCRKKLHHKGRSMIEAIWMEIKVPMVLWPSTRTSQEGVHPDISTAGVRNPETNSNSRWPGNSSGSRSEIRLWSSMGSAALDWGGRRRRRLRQKSQTQAIRMRVKGSPRPMPKPSVIVCNLE